MSTAAVNKTTYPTYFADYRRSSFIAVNSDCRGEIGWARVLDLPEDIVPRAVLVWEGYIGVETDENFILFDRAGKRLWERAKAPRSPVAIGNNLLYYLNNDYFLDAANVSNQTLLDDESFPEATNEDYPVALFAPQAETFVAVIQFIGGEDDTPPAVRFHMTDYGDPVSTWEHSFEGIQDLPPLFLSEIQRLIIFMKDIACFDATNGKEVSRFDFPVTSPLVASADQAGVLYVLGRHEDKNALIALTQDGVEKWRWVDSVGVGNFSERQPPVIGVENNVHLVADAAVLTVNEGRLIWKFELEETEEPEARKPLFSYGTALADGTMLVTAGSMLYRLGKAGEVMLATDIGRRLVAPPVVDADGNIYVASETQLVQIR